MGLDDQITAARRRVGENLDDVGACVRLGRLLERAGRSEEAIDVYSELLSRHDDDHARRPFVRLVLRHLGFHPARRHTPRWTVIARGRPQRLNESLVGTLAAFPPALIVAALAIRAFPELWFAILPIVAIAASFVRACIVHLLEDRVVWPFPSPLLLLDRKLRLAFVFYTLPLLRGTYRTQVFRFDEIAPSEETRETPDSVRHLPALSVANRWLFALRSHTLESLLKPPAGGAPSMQR